MSDLFYAELPSFANARDVCNLSHYTEVPDGWTVIVTDVEGSTAAIEAGRYRDVNLIGAATITAARNAAPELQIAYVFGGDGATLLIPSSAVPVIRTALLGLRVVAKERFDLGLRVGGASVDELRARGAAVLVAKLEISKGLCLAMFAGGGLAEAEALVKGGTDHLWVEDDVPAPNLTGLECRWRPIASEHGEILSVLIRATAGGGTGPEASATYARLIDEIGGIIGKHDEVNPARSRHMGLSTSPMGLRNEQRIKRGAAASSWANFSELMLMWVKTLIGRLFMQRRTVTDATDWGKYRDGVTRHSDYWKYDDTLRFVIDVSSEQKQGLVACLERYESNKEIVFGAHSAKEAVMTCVVFDHDTDHVHFIDGGDGGYARAAKQMKQKLK